MLQEKWLELWEELEEKGYKVVDVGMCVRLLCIGGPDDVLHIEGPIKIYEVYHYKGPKAYCDIYAVIPPGENGRLVLRKRSEMCGARGWSSEHIVQYVFYGDKYEVQNLDSR